MIGYLEEMGFGSIGAMGDKVPLSFLEIDAFMRVTKTELNHWEATTIKDLSYIYIVQSQQKELGEMPPFLEVDEFTYLSSLNKI